VFDRIDEPDAAVPRDQQQWQRGPDVCEDEGVDRRREMVAADPQRDPVQIARAEIRVGVSQRHHCRGLRDSGVGENAERADHHAREHDPLQ
jgi:hypothetical protein